MYEGVWRLHGPRSLVRDAVREYSRGRHLAIVLPSAMSRDTSLTEDLALELINDLPRSADIKQIAPDPNAGSLLAAIGRSLVFDEYPPASNPDLLHHRDACGWVAMIVAAEQPENHQRELPELLQRLDRESRSGPTNERLSVIVIGSRAHLPHFAGGETSDIKVATVWWWNRVSRWDVAAHISETRRTHAEHRVLTDVRTETIVEVARWDLDLAEQLAESWSGDPSSLTEFLSLTDVKTQSNMGTVCGTRPTEAVIDMWDDGLIDGWHDSQSVTPHALADAPERLARQVWAAQARILMPWIEECRVILQEQAVTILGPRRFREALRNMFPAESVTNTNSIEIGPLRMIVNARIGGSNPKLRSAAIRLHDARNRLAHLEPLGFAELKELVVACQTLV